MEILRWCRNEWERAGAVALVIVGAIVLILGWVGVSGVGLPSEQIPYVVSGGLVGIFLLAIGLTLWLSADLHDEWRKLDRLEEILSSSGSPPADKAASVTEPTPVVAEAAMAAHGSLPAQVWASTGAPADEAKKPRRPRSGSRNPRPSPKASTS